MALYRLAGHVGLRPCEQKQRWSSHPFEPAFPRSLRALPARGSAVSADVRRILPRKYRPRGILASLDVYLPYVTSSPATGAPGVVKDPSIVVLVLVLLAEVVLGPLVETELGLEAGENNPASRTRAFQYLLPRDPGYRLFI